MATMNASARVRAPACFRFATDRESDRDRAFSIAEVIAHNGLEHGDALLQIDRESIVR